MIYSGQHYGILISLEFLNDQKKMENIFCTLCANFIIFDCRIKTLKIRMTGIALRHQLIPHHTLTTALIPLGAPHSSILKHRKKSSVSSVDNEIAKNCWQVRIVARRFICLIRKTEIKFENEQKYHRKNSGLFNNHSLHLGLRFPCLFSIFLPEQTSQAGHRSCLHNNAAELTPGGKMETYEHVVIYEFYRKSLTVLLCNKMLDIFVLFDNFLF